MVGAEITGGALPSVAPRMKSWPKPTPAALAIMSNLIPTARPLVLEKVPRSTASLAK